MIQTLPPVSQETLADWQRQLDELFPPSEITSHIKIAWVAGDDWVDGDLHQGIERFFLFEMMPEEYIDPWILFELKEMPRPVVRYDSVMQSVAREVERFVTRQQWDLYQETKHFAKYWWVIQGDKGGHQRSFTTHEKQWLKLEGLPTEPPLPGTLPYAPFDGRVKAQILKHDQLRKVGERLMLLKSSQKEKYRALAADTEKRFREAILDFVKGQITMDDARTIKRHSPDMGPIITPDFEKMWEQGEQRFVETGRFE